MKPITIIPAGGLCNRMRALNSSLALAEHLGSPLAMIWGRDHSLNCRYDQLFTHPAALTDLIDIDLHSSRGLLAKRLLIAWRSRVGRYFYDQAFVAAALRAGTDLSPAFAGKRAVIETSSAFYPAADFGRLVPVADLAGRIGACAANLADRVGVHIRRTDNRKSTDGSPTADFVGAMRGMLDAGECRGFFLATDSPDEERTLKDLFPGRIFAHPKTSYDRNDSAAIREALVDLYSLAQCKMILGSYWSSFSETAAAIGGRKLHIIKESST